MKFWRFRNTLLVIGSAIVLAALLSTDPDNGLSTGMMVLGAASPLIAVAFAHLVRKGLFDYKEADLQALFKKAGENSIGAGLALVAVALVLSALLGLFGRGAHAAQPDVRTYIPTQAELLRAPLAKEFSQSWPDHPRREYVPAAMEQESCLSLTHSRCMNPKSQLKTSREEGAGVGQITRAYRPDGSLRFDALAEMRDAHPALRELNWNNVYDRVDLQLRALLLKMRGDFNWLARIPDVEDRLLFADAVYNRGRTGIDSDRRLCQLTAGCNPQKWFGHVQHTCTGSKTPVYGKRTVCDINREHVFNVVVLRAPKYVGWV